MVIPSINLDLHTYDAQIVEKNMDRLPNAKTGPGVTRKMKRVVKNEIDFRSK
jgi:hypothetical protein